MLIFDALITWTLTFAVVVGNFAVTFVVKSEFYTAYFALRPFEKLLVWYIKTFNSEVIKLFMTFIISIDNVYYKFSRVKAAMVRVTLVLRCRIL